MNAVLIIEVLKDYRYIEVRGMGIRKKIVPLLRESSNTEPEFIATEDFVRHRVAQADLAGRFARYGIESLGRSSYMAGGRSPKQV